MNGGLMRNYAGVARCSPNIRTSFTPVDVKNSAKHDAIAFYR